MKIVIAIYSKLIKPVFGLIYSYFQKFYSNLYEKIDTIKKWTARITISFDILMICFYIYNQKKLLLFYAFNVSIVVVSAVIILVLYHKLFGTWIIIHYQQSLTQLWIEQRFPKIVKIFGPTRVGKDSLASGITYKLSQYLKTKCLSEMLEAKNKLYLIDFDRVDYVLSLDYQARRFMTPSDNTSMKAFADILENNDGFLKKVYYSKFSKNRINYKFLINDWKDSMKDIKDFDTKYKYNDNINPCHYYGILFSYIKNYVRLYYGENFVIANQPYREDEHLMAKEFSMDFLKSKQGPVKKIKDELGEQVYREKVRWCIPEKVVLYETEADTWYNNKDNEMISLVMQYGITNTKAYNGHLFGEDFYHIQVGQSASRIMAVLRDYDHAYIQVLHKEDIWGGSKRNFLIGIPLAIINFLINSSEASLEKHNIKINYKKRVLYQNYKEKWLRTKRRKYYNKYCSFFKLKEKDNSSLIEHLIKLRVKLQEKIDKNKNDGALTFMITLSPNEISSNLETVSLNELLDSKKPFFKQSYQMVLTFKKNDCHGRYNTHYLNGLKEFFAKNSDETFYDVPRWRPSMKISSKDMLYMGYKSAYAFFNFSQKDILNERYLQKK